MKAKEKREELTKQRKQWSQQCKKLCMELIHEYKEKYGTDEITFDEENRPTSVFINRWDELKECHIDSIRAEDDDITMNIEIDSSGDKIEDLEPSDMYMMFGNDWINLAESLEKEIKEQ